MPLSEPHSDALAEIYARSLYTLAEGKGGRELVEQINAELEDIQEIALADPRFAEFLASRVLPAASRSASIDRIFKGRLADLTLRFLHVLNDKGRLYHLPAIAAAFDAMVQAQFGRIEVDVYTVSTLERDEQAEIEAAIRAGLGREPIVHHYTDPAMVGGVRIQVGDRLIDASVATQLRRLREQLMTQGMARMRARAERIIGGEESA